MKILCDGVRHANTTEIPGLSPGWATTFKPNLRKIAMVTIAQFTSAALEGLGMTRDEWCDFVSDDNDDDNDSQNLRRANHGLTATRPKRTRRHH